MVFYFSSFIRNVVNTWLWYHPTGNVETSEDNAEYNTQEYSILNILNNNTYNDLIFTKNHSVFPDNQIISNQLPD